MNINTATLLSMLSASNDTSVKDKVTKLSIDGKVDVATLVKDKTIGNLIGNLFQDISSGVKTKNEISTLILNNKQTFNFKNLSEDIKLLVKFLQTNISSNEKLTQPLQTLKASLVDIKNIDEKVVKENISNSGVFLESKLLKESTPLSKNIQEVISSIKEQLSLIKSSISKVNIEPIKIETTTLHTQQDIPKDIKVEIKNAIENTLKDIKNITQENTTTNKQLQILKDIDTSINKLQNRLDTNNVKSDIANNLKELILNIKSNIGVTNLENIKNSLLIIQEKITSLPSEVSKDLKAEIKNILTSFETLKNTISPMQKQEIFTNILQKALNLQSTLPQVIDEKNIGIKENLAKDIKGAILQIQEIVETAKEPISKELKATVEKVLSQIELAQLQSYTTNSTHSYISFLQDTIEDADIQFSSSKEESVSCQINLSMKEFGEIKVLMILDKEKNININLGIENKTFKAMIQEKLQILRLGFNNIGLAIQSLNVFDIENHTTSRSAYTASSFENVSFGVDIQA